VPVAEAGPDETICLGQSVELEGSGGLTYTWSPSSALNFLNIANPLATPSQDETFYVTTTSPEGCIATDSVTIFVVQNAPGGVVYPNVEICLGETAFLQAENAGSWTWSPLNSLNDGNAQNVQATPDETTTYTITMTNICGSGISEVTVEVIELNINASEGGTVCGGTPFPISVTGASLYQWYPVNSVTDFNDSVTFALPESSQWIYVVGTDLNGCSDLDSLYMNILPLPQVDAGPDQYFSFPGEAQLFGNTFGLDYSWSPSNGLSCVACPYPVASPPAPQWYVLSATDDLGCVGVDSVYVRPYFPVYVPNAITPNQDGLNDVFLVVGENLTGFHLEIYDRWGMLVFESNDQAKPWLADYKGYYVQNDVYTWKLSYDSLERRTEQIGHVTVIR
jgi:gliding motility-associated-like protein